MLLGAVGFILSPNDIITDVGDSLALTCTASGIPAPQISWYKDMELLLANEFNITEVILLNTSSYFTVSVLYLCDVQFPDSGMYSCTGSREGVEEDSRSFLLEAQGELLNIYFCSFCYNSLFSLPQHHCSTCWADCEPIHSSGTLLQCVWRPSATSGVVHKLRRWPHSCHCGGQCSGGVHGG